MRYQVEKRVDASVVYTLTVDATTKEQALFQASQTHTGWEEETVVEFDSVDYVVLEE